MMNVNRDVEVQSCKARIEKLKARAAAMCHGEFYSFQDDKCDCPLEVQEEFWKQVVAMEEGRKTTLAEVLKENGFELPSAKGLQDEQVTVKLWALIRKMAELQCFLTHTDHLSDRELYEHLLKETLQEEIDAASVACGPEGAWHYDLIGGGSDEDIQVMLRYYSDEVEREQWHCDFPDDVIPPISIPPYDRDRLLPRWQYDRMR